MIAQITKRMIEYFGNDVRRINHALKVYSFAKTIAELEQLDKKQQLIVEATALLHDIGIKEAERKYNSSAGNFQEIEGPAIALIVLNEIGFPEDLSKRVCFIVGNHHTLTKIDGIDFQIIVEADFLVNIDEDLISKETIKTIHNKHFKTQSGTTLLHSIFE